MVSYVKIFHKNHNRPSLILSSMTSLITNFCIFPVTVVGNSVTKVKYLGILKCEIFPLQNFLISSSWRLCPGLSFTQAQSSSPILASLTPKACKVRGYTGEMSE